MKKRVNKTTIICSLILIVITVIMLCTASYLNHSHNNQNITQNGIKWDGCSTTTTSDNNKKYIAIPCFTDINFVANKTTQKVNIYNPEENECIMDISIVLSDGMTIWEMDNIHPGYGVHDIELSESLLPGTYDAQIITKCFTLDKKSELNGASFRLKINVKGEMM